MADLLPFLWVTSGVDPSRIGNGDGRPIGHGEQAFSEMSAGLGFVYLLEILPTPSVGIVGPEPISQLI